MAAGRITGYKLNEKNLNQKKYHNSLFQFIQMFHLNIQSAIFLLRKLED
jgi:hypothetical protein